MKPAALNGAAFLVGMVLGAIIWGASPLLAGAMEPWDAESPYYFISLFVAGGLAGLMFPRHIWVAFMGIVFGQLAYMLVALPTDPLLLLGVLFLFGYAMISLLGLALASWARR